MSVSGSEPPAPIRPSVVPPLEPGDRLTRDEFERRFDATPGLTKAELWLATRAMAAGDSPGVLAALQTGLASPEHAAFVQQLAAAREG